MAMKIKLAVGSDMTLDRSALTIVRKFLVTADSPRGGLPYVGPDAFDFVASEVMAKIEALYPTYTTQKGVLYWNSIQLNEEYYAQKYTASVTYSPWPETTGTYQVTIDQAVGNVRATAGVNIATYNSPGQVMGTKQTTFWDGFEMGGEDVPVPMDRMTISYRHPKAFLNANYIRAIGKLRGYPNADTFLGYDPGEVRYMGGNFSQTECEASASYAFDISPNVQNVQFGECLITEKKGFDSISPTYMAATADGNGVRKVKGVTVLRTREWKDYKSVFLWG